MILNLLLKNIRLYSKGKEFSGDLRIRNGKIVERSIFLEPRRKERVLELSGFLVFPGLINSHDHLEMNLFPRMGNPPYSNFYDWANFIYHPKESPIRDILQVSLKERLWWGAYKNLISGVTTVVHHNPFYKKVFNKRFPIKVLKKFSWSHSIGHGNNLRKSFLKSRNKPYIIHAAEGVDAESSMEIEKLEQIGLLGSNSVIVHGAAIREDQIQKLANTGVSIIWCPASNLYLFGKTAPINQMKSSIQVAVGTDSTLSGSPTLLKELRVAHSTGMATATELLEMVTSNPQSIFKLKIGSGTLDEGASADMLVLTDYGKMPTETLLNTTLSDVAMVMVDGEVRLANSSLAEKLGIGKLNVYIENTPKWIYGDISTLIRRIQQVVGVDILSANPLWNLIDPIE